MEKELAQYIAELESGWKQAKWAEDRVLYEKYLAQAACIMSKLILGVSREELFTEIETNEKLWGTTWLHDPAPQQASEYYSRFKALSGYPG